MGGGVVFAVAAALWIAYLLPSWMRRREYLATERTAVRLQQTLRILAETSELPEEVRVEAKARAIAEHEKVIRKAEEKALAETRAAAAAEARARRVAEAHAERLDREQAERARVQAEAARAQRIEAERVQQRLEQAVAAAGAGMITDDVDAAGIPGSAARAATRGRAQTRAKRLRRARAATSLTLLLGLAATVAGAFSFFAAGGSGILFISGAVVGVCSLVMQIRLAGEGRRVARANIAAPAPVAAAAPLYDHATEEPAAAAPATWTPQPLPLPLHLSRGSAAATAMATIDAAAELRRAAAQAEIDERAARIARTRPAVPIVPFMPAGARGDAPAARTTRSAAAASDRAAAAPATAFGEREGVPGASAPSRFASMGLVDDADDRAMDLDAALRRRRAAG